MLTIAREQQKLKQQEEQQELLQQELVQQQELEPFQARSKRMSVHRAHSLLSSHATS
jgi:hypothetical protein